MDYGCNTFNKYVLRQYSHALYEEYSKRRLLIWIQLYRKSLGKGFCFSPNVWMDLSGLNKPNIKYNKASLKFIRTATVSMTGWTCSRNTE